MSMDPVEIVFEVACLDGINQETVDRYRKGELRTEPQGPPRL